MNLFFLKFLRKIDDFRHDPPFFIYFIFSLLGYFALFIMSVDFQGDFSLVFYSIFILFFWNFLGKFPKFMPFKYIRDKIFFGLFVFIFSFSIFVIDNNFVSLILIFFIVGNIIIFPFLLKTKEIIFFTLSLLVSFFGLVFNFTILYYKAFSSLVCIFLIYGFLNDLKNLPNSLFSNTFKYFNKSYRAIDKVKQISFQIILSLLIFLFIFSIPFDFDFFNDRFKDETFLTEELYAEQKKLFVPGRIGAECFDGTFSKATGRGACSHHGGVREWIYAKEPTLEEARRKAANISWFARMR